MLTLLYMVLRISSTVDLMGEADGFDVMLEWTAPDLTAWEPPA